MYDQSLVARHTRSEDHNSGTRFDMDVRQIETKNSFKTHITKVICRDVNHPG